MPYNFRDRGNIKPPNRLEDPDEEHREVSYKEPDIEQEVFAPPITPMSSRARYRGRVVPFNPALPPAVFPTLDCTRQAQPHIDQIIDLVNPLPSDEEGTPLPTGVTKMANRPASGSNNVQHFGQSHGCLQQPCTEIRIGDAGGHQSRNLPERNNREIALWRKFQRDMHPQHDGTSSSILSDNMRRMKQAASMGSFDRNMLEMESSEEEDDQSKPFPEWKDLTSARKVQLLEIVAESYPNEDPTGLLRLEEFHREELQKLIKQRDERLFREQANGKRHRKELHQKLLRGAIMNEDRFRQSLERHLYQDLDKSADDDDFDLSTTSQLEQAKGYLHGCGLNPKLLDSAWADTPSSDVDVFSRMHRVAFDPCVTNEMNRDTINPIANNQTVFESTGQDYKIRMKGSNGKGSRPHRMTQEVVDGAGSPNENAFTFIRHPQNPNNLEFHKIEGSETPSDPVSSQISSVERGEDVTREPQCNRIGSSSRHERHPPGFRQISQDKSAKDGHPVTSKKPIGKSAIGTKHRVSSDSETCFLNAERRVGARQPKLTVKAAEAQNAASIQAESTPTKTSEAISSNKKKKSSVPNRNQMTTDLDKTPSVKKRASRVT